MIVTYIKQLSTPPAVHYVKHKLPLVDDVISDQSPYPVLIVGTSLQIGQHVFIQSRIEINPIYIELQFKFNIVRCLAVLELLDIVCYVVFSVAEHVVRGVCSSGETLSKGIGCDFIHTFIEFSILRSIRFHSLINVGVE